MNFDSGTVIRIIRGIIGVVLIIVGIIYSNWIGFLGAFFLFGAVTGGCGFGAASCPVNQDKKENEESIHNHLY